MSEGASHLRVSAQFYCSLTDERSGRNPQLPSAGSGGRDAAGEREETQRHHMKTPPARGRLWACDAVRARLARPTKRHLFFFVLCAAPVLWCCALTYVYWTDAGRSRVGHHTEVRLMC